MTTLQSIESHALAGVTGGTGIVQGVKDAFNTATNWAFGAQNVNQGPGTQRNGDKTVNKTVNHYNGCSPPPAAP